MRLLLDIGNTRLKWAVQSQQGLSGQRAMAIAGLTVARLRNEVFASLNDVSQVRVSNVAGEDVAQLLRQAAQEHWRLAPQFVTAEAQAVVRGRIIRNAYAQPQQLGVDRWLALLGAAALTPKTVLVASVGTAMTLDALDASGQHLGGLIVPGPALMTRTLLRHTSDIAERAARPVPARPGQGFFADNTRDCVENGSVLAAASLVASVHAQLAVCGELQVLLTGGAAETVQSLLGFPHQWVPDLVLQGLALG